MQAGKGAAEAMKEKGSNVAASARAGMEKTKATAQEKKERMTAHDPMEKEMATEKKDVLKTQAEMDKQMAQEHNAAAREAAATGGQGTVPLHTTGRATGIHHPGYGTGGTDAKTTNGSGI
ncbi:hypothetical protein PVL29_010821 [Vitis rotundifolia]|uniref:Uncharacterized protein n=1 Tax=Vitis rotundifolia TaxID=103349 RepID=A0AA39DSM9_VITRO|nr:hypothetical protein PVL29_010821 [Vitis rotundifolia]